MADRVDPEQVAAAGDTRRIRSSEASQAAREAVNEARNARSAAFSASMEQTLANLPSDEQAPRARSAAPSQSAAPTQTQAPRRQPAAATPHNLLPPGFGQQSNDPVGDSIEHNDRAYVAAVAAVANTSLTQSQRTQAFQSALGDNEVFDLNGNGRVDAREAQAVANTVWRDSVRGKSVETIARNLTSDETLNRARDSIASENQNRGGLIVPQGNPDLNGHQR